MIEINQNTALCDNEIKLTASKSSGPGGQNVNKLNTKVTLHFDVFDSSLSPEKKESISRKLHNRINREGVLKLSCQEYRTQIANKKAVMERFTDLLADALVKPRKRKKHRLSRQAKARRLAAKRHRKEIKKMRKKVEW